MQSAERVADDIAFYRQMYGVDSFEFVDDMFNFDPDRVIRLSELLTDANIKIRFSTLLRGDIVTEAVADALVAAGASFLGFSLETGSSRLQKFTGKYLNIPRFLRAVDMIAERRIYMFGYMMLGFPTETEAELQQTIDTACAAPFHGASFFTVTPFPGSPLYETVWQTHPEKLVDLQYADADYAGMRVNLTDLPDEVLYEYQRLANRRFFMNPRRIARLVRDFPYPLALPRYMPILMYRATKGLFSWPSSR